MPLARCHRRADLGPPIGCSWPWPLQRPIKDHGRPGVLHGGKGRPVRLVATHRPRRSTRSPPGPRLPRNAGRRDGSGGSPPQSSALTAAVNIVAGPGEYIGPDRWARSGPAYTMTFRPKPANQPDVPGPGAYESHKVQGTCSPKRQLFVALPFHVPYLFPRCARPAAHIGAAAPFADPSSVSLPSDKHVARCLRLCRPALPSPSKGSTQLLSSPGPGLESTRCSAYLTMQPRTALPSLSLAVQGQESPALHTCVCCPPPLPWTRHVAWPVGESIWGREGEGRARLRDGRIRRFKERGLCFPLRGTKVQVGASWRVGEGCETEAGRGRLEPAALSGRARKWGWRKLIAVTSWGRGGRA